MGSGERGSVLMLMPAAVLVFLVLGALCVDYGAVFDSQRELNGAAAAAANDVATQALDVPRYYATGELRILPERAWRIAAASVAAAGLDRLHAEVTDVDVDGDRVVVSVSGRVHHLFAKALPGGRDGTDIRSTSEAEARELP